MDSRALCGGRERDNPVDAIISAIADCTGDHYLMVLHAIASVVRHDERVRAAVNVIQEAEECLTAKR